MEKEKNILNNSQEEKDDYIKMDWSIEDPKERVALVEKIIASTPPERLTQVYLDKMAEYIIKPNTIKERQEEYKVLTANREKVLNERETSFEGLVAKFEKGEDGIYNIMSDNKNVILSPKKPITEEDIKSIPALKQLVDAIEIIKEQSKHARGKRAFLLKKQLISMYNDQYVIREAYQKPIYCTNLIKSISKLDLSEEITVTEDGDVISTGLLNLYDPIHISELLSHYSKLKENAWSDFVGDTKWLIMDLEAIIDEALKEKYPMYYDLLIYKIDGKKNIEIQELLENKYGIKHSVEYISSLWRKKIPKLIAEQAKENYLMYYYTFIEKGKWKKCSRCGQIKLAHNKYFSKNKTSKDNFYSICKECRNKKKISY